VFRTLISTHELEVRLADPALVILDVRHDLADPDTWGREQYDHGHIPGALFVHLDHDLSARTTGRNGRHPLPSREDAALVFARLGVDERKQVVAYDQDSGTYAARCWWMLRWLGHEAVAVLDGGMRRWVAEGRVLEAEPNVAAPAQFTPRPPLQASIAIETLLQDPAHRRVLVDARAPERFRGDVEPIDARAGHIPGAINRPYARNLGPQGTFRAPDELRGELLQLLGDRAPADVVHHCGSGVSACHNVLAFEHAGLSGSLLYAGSWSEWSADPARPVARGE
jgi:thiosulfate/3-mercaptopyruvate sulfurtransferase